MKRLLVLTAGGSPEEIGRAHGSRFSADIRSYMEDRIELSRTGTHLDRRGVLAIAEAMLTAHRAYDEPLYREMEAMADAAGITPAEAVIVGGYTDFIDAVRAIAHGTAVEDTCTAVITPDAESGGAGFLAQTWDMHASATPHVFMFDIAPDDAPRAMVFTTHGTVGQIGMNDAGIAVGINNLTTDDGRVGVTWPFVVRKVLRQTSFDDALRCILEAELAGGHNFLLFDRNGSGASIEATSTVTHVEALSEQPLAHTNHCLVPRTQEVEADRPPSLQANSIARYLHATEALEASDEFTAASLMELLRDERSICRRPEPPFDYESSGAVVMRPATGDLWAVWGVPSDHDFEHFTVAGAASR
jgi:isopenicillin-N N-acyltransferase like protein